MGRKQPLSKVLNDYQPAPGRLFYQKMEAAPWKRQKKMLSVRFAWQAAAAVFLVLLVLGFSIPSVRASVSAWLGLSVAPSNQMPAAAVTLEGPASTTPSGTAPASSLPALPQPEALASPTPVQEAVSGDQPEEIRQLSAQAGWEILTPGSLPEGYRFQSAYLDANHQMVILTYAATRPLPGAADPSLTETKTITLLQAQTNDFTPMQVAPDTNLEDVQVSGQPAVYAVGAWDTEFVPDDQDPNGGKMVSTWRSDLPVKNLYWQVGKLYLLVLTDDDAVSRQVLLDLAASVSRP